MSKFCDDKPPRLGWPFIVALTLIAWIVLNIPAITLTLVLR